MHHGCSMMVKSHGFQRSNLPARQGGLVASAPTRVQQILVIHLGGIGDALLATPALQSIRALYPEAKCTVMVPARVAEIVRTWCDVDEIVAVEFDAVAYRGWRLLWNWRAWHLLRACLRLRRTGIDFIVNLCSLTSWPGAIKMAILCGIIGGRYRAGRDTDGRGFFLTHRVPEHFGNGQSTHEVECVLRIARMLGSRNGSVGPECRTNWQDEEAATAFLTAHGIRAHETIVAVNPGTAWPSHRWRLERFAEVVRGLNGRRPCRFVITGGATDLPLARHLRDLVEVEASIAAGTLSLGATAALIRRCRLMITNDTAAMHLASASQTPTVAILGSTDVARFRPLLPEGRYAILQHAVGCHPCERPRCWRRSLDHVKVDEVLEACVKLLGSSAKE